MKWYALSGAYVVINEALRNHEYPKLNPFLIKLSGLISEIMKQRDWLQENSLLLQQPQQPDQKPITQLGLMNEALNAHKETLAFTYKQVKQLRKEIIEFKSWDLEESEDLKKYLLDCCNETLNHVESQAKIKAGWIPKQKLADEDSGNVDEKNDFYEVSIKEIELNSKPLTCLKICLNLINKYLNDYSNVLDEGEITQLDNYKSLIETEILKIENWERERKANNMNLIDDIEYQRSILAIANSLREELNKLVFIIDPIFRQQIEKFLHAVLDETYNHYRNLLLAPNSGARFFPFRQSYDPLIGRSSDRLYSTGVCFGHVMEWCREIIRQGRMVKLPRFDVATLVSHKNQPNDETYVIYKKNSNKVFDKVLEEILNNLLPDRIYALNSLAKAGHSIGLRRIGNEIEVFDPNFGIVIFDNAENCFHWFSKLLKEVYGMDKTDIELSPIGIQDPNIALPSIPPLDQKHQNQNTFQKNNSVENFSMFQKTNDDRGDYKPDSSSRAETSSSSDSLNSSTSSGVTPNKSSSG